MLAQVAFDPNTDDYYDLILSLLGEYLEEDLAEVQPIYKVFSYVFIRE